MEVQVKIPEGIVVTENDSVITVKGPNAELSKTMKHPKVRVNVEGDTVTISSKEEGRRERAVVGTYRSHLKNLFHGVTKGYTVTMKIVSTHFPITAKVVGDNIVVENFLGERNNRKANIVGNSKIDINGDEIAITGHDKEDVGQTAGNIESATRVVGKDRRVFKDGIYIMQKIANE